MLKNVTRLFLPVRGNYGSNKYITLLNGVKIPQTSVRFLAGDVKDGEGTKEGFDTSILEFLVCPLSKKTLRYDEETNELINDELGIAYPVVDGIPNMIPQDARMIHRTPDKEKPAQP